MTTGAAGKALGAAGEMLAAAVLAGEVLVGEVLVGEVLAEGGVAAVRAPNSVGFHQTTRNATARPTTTALTKKPTRTRVFCN
jgi:hypothetical protein